jgi:hypothetical protein
MRLYLDSFFFGIIYPENLSKKISLAVEGIGYKRKKRKKGKFCLSFNPNKSTKKPLKNES